MDNVDVRLLDTQSWARQRLLVSMRLCEVAARYRRCALSRIRNPANRNRYRNATRFPCRKKQLMADTLTQLRQKTFQPIMITSCSRQNHDSCNLFIEMFPTMFRASCDHIMHAAEPPNNTNASTTTNDTNAYYSYYSYLATRQGTSFCKLCTQRREHESLI